MLALEEPPANIWTCCTSGSCVKAANACGARQACEADSLRDSRTLSGFFCLLCIAVASLCFLSGRSGCAAEEYGSERSVPSSADLNAVPEAGTIRRKAPPSFLLPSANLPFENVPEMFFKILAEGEKKPNIFNKVI